jgi:hypothetical protein
MNIVDLTSKDQECFDNFLTSGTTYSVNPFNREQLNSFTIVSYIDAEFQGYRMPGRYFIPTPNYHDSSDQLTTHLLLSFGSIDYVKNNDGNWKPPIFNFQLFPYEYVDTFPMFANPLLLHSKFFIANNMVLELVKAIDKYSERVPGRVNLPFLKDTPAAAAELFNIKRKYNTFCSSLLQGDFDRFHRYVLMNKYALLVTKGKNDLYAIFNTCKLLNKNVCFNCKWLNLDDNNYLSPILTSDLLPNGTLTSYYNLYKKRYIFAEFDKYLKSQIQMKLAPLELGGTLVEHNPLFDAYMHMIMHNGMSFDYSIVMHNAYNNNPRSFYLLTTLTPIQQDGTFDTTNNEQISLIDKNAPLDRKFRRINYYYAIPKHVLRELDSPRVSPPVPAGPPPSPPPLFSGAHPYKGGSRHSKKLSKNHKKSVRRLSRRSR